MVVFVQFLGLHKKLVRNSEIQLSLPEDARVQDVLEVIQDKYPQLDLSKKDVVITVNNKVSKPEQALRPRDNITFVPHIGGG